MVEAWSIKNAHTNKNIRDFFDKAWNLCGLTARILINVRNLYTVCGLTARILINVRNLYTVCCIKHKVKFNTMRLVSLL